MSTELAGKNDKIRRWKTCLSVIVDDRNRMAHVTFEHAPPEYGFVDYIVSLNDAVKKRNILRIQTNTTSANFTDLKNGDYTIVVYPINDNNCYPFCSRRKSDIFSIERNTNNLLNLTVCGNDTRTKTLINRPLEATATPNIWKFYLLFLSLIFVIIAFIVYRRKRRHITADNLSSLKNNTTTSTGKVKVFVIYAEDHPFHTEACQSFVHYLNEHCFCDVLNTYPEYDSVPVPDMEKHSDFVLVINSQTLYCEFRVWKFRETYPDMKSYFCHELFEKILQNVKESPSSGTCEYLMCAMDYTDDKYIPLEFGRCEPFKIIDDMTDLVCYIQKLDLSSIKGRDIPRVSEHIYTSPDGNALLSAIEDARYFEKTHPNWFQEENISVSVTGCL